MSARRYLRALSALLFLAVCAYAGARLWDGLSPGARAVQAQRASIARSVALEGVALRREEAVAPERSDAVRLAAGASLAEGLTLSDAALYVPGTDGLEALSPEAAEPLSVSRVAALLETADSARAGGGGRLVYGFSWVFAALTDGETELRAGARCRLRFEGQETPVSASVLALSEAEEGHQAVLLRLTESGEFYLNLRQSRARLLLSEISGLSLPAEAVHSEGGETWVWTPSASLAQQRVEVELLYADGESCLVAETDALRENDWVLLG